MKCPLGISNFLEEISSLSHSVVFLFFFALFTEEGFLVSPCCSLEVCIQMGIAFLFSCAFHLSSLLFSSQLFVRKFMTFAGTLSTLGSAVLNGVEQEEELLRVFLG